MLVLLYPLDFGIGSSSLKSPFSPREETAFCPKCIQITQNLMCTKCCKPTQLPADLGFSYYPSLLSEVELQSPWGEYPNTLENGWSSWSEFLHFYLWAVELLAWGIPYCLEHLDKIQNQESLTIFSFELFLTIRSSLLIAKNLWQARFAPCSGWCVHPIHLGLLEFISPSVLWRTVWFRKECMYRCLVIRPFLLQSETLIFMPLLFPTRAKIECK